MLDAAESPQVLPHMLLWRYGCFAERRYGIASGYRLSLSPLATASGYSGATAALPAEVDATVTGALASAAE